MPKVRHPKDDDKIVIKFDIPTLNMLIKYSLCDNNVTKTQMGNLQKFINYLDLDAYRYNQEIVDRLFLIKDICSAKLDHNMKNPDMIHAYISKENPELLEPNGLVDNIGLESNTLNSSECKFLNDVVNERLEYMFLYQAKDNVIKYLQKLDKGGFVSYYETVNTLKGVLSELLVNLQNAAINNGLIRSMDFSGDNFSSVLDTIIQQAKIPKGRLQTGIRLLNSALAGGFKACRLYTWLGFSGKFKSGMLLNIADQIRRFNPQIKGFENGRRKTILFVTMENTIAETVERLFDMYNHGDDEISNYTVDEVIKILKDNGHFNFTDTDGIDIDMRYYSNLEIKTCQLYNIITELNDNGKEVICLILDYLKRIDSTMPNNGDERTRISYASKELKSLSVFFQIPVITAMQINREGNGIIDAAMREDKQDLARLVGSSQIGNCWDVVEESDWMGLLNLELHSSTKELYLTIKRLKSRGKKDPNSLDYFNHPFADGKEIRLETDVDKANSVSVISLSSDLESVDDKQYNNLVKMRPRVSTTKKPNAILESIGIDALAV